MNKRLKKKNQNQGNSYIMVVATLSFLAVLVAALLVAIATLYNLKAYDINSRDNFYYLEQAMDEIYAGIGSKSMEMLTDAYNDTVEVLVYYDLDSKSYVTMTDEQANSIFRSTYLQKVDKYYTETIGSTNDDLRNYFISFLSNPYVASTNEEGVQVAVGNVARTQVDGVDSIIFTNVVLKREAYYSTVNTRKADKTEAISDKFVQTLTTDIVVSTPDFNVSFNTVGAELSDLYSFSLISDLGVEVTGSQTKVDITGNIYAAADFYNKDYNITDKSNVNYLGGADGKKAKEYATINDTAYDDANYNGQSERSMYSGFYVGGAEVVISADRIIVPGSIAAMNCGTITLSGQTLEKSEVWADGIVVGGYSKKATADADYPKGSSIVMRADAYIYDDLELNATGADFKLTGNYYGYNYASTDNRKYNNEVQKNAEGRSFASKVASTIKDGATIEGQNHYNSSSIIVNGEHSNLDLAGVENMYIAGQAYVELSKQTTATEVEVTNLDGTNYVEDTAKAGGTIPELDPDSKAETTNVNTYSYAEQSKTDKGDPDNYSAATDTDSKEGKASNILDYRTGEAISVKSNQLAYIPNGAVKDTDEGLYFAVPESFKGNGVYADLFQTTVKNEKDEMVKKTIWDDLAKVPVIKSVISGKTYYFFDFSNAAIGMNEYIEKYAELFTLKSGEEISRGEAAGLANITDYEYFRVENVIVKDAADGKGGFATDANGNIAGVYSNSAISVKSGATLTVKANSSSVAPLLEAANAINSNVDKHNAGIVLDEDGNASAAEEKGLATNGITESSSADVKTSLASNITAKLQQQYKEAKWLLSASSKNPDGVTEAHAMEESDISPINHFIDVQAISTNKTFNDLLCGYDAFVYEDDITLTGKDIKGLVICKGDVTFDSSVESFEGLVIAGGKIIVDHDMSFIANEEIIKSIIRESDERQVAYGSTTLHGLFRQYKSFYKEPEDANGITTANLRDVSAVQFEDILSFRNWIKNVD